MKLTDHFSTEELGEVPAQYASNRQRTAELLEGIRSLLGVPLDVSNGYRPPDKNAKTPGASKTSGHLIAAAADFTPRGVTPFEAATILLAARKAGKMPPFGEIIFYPFSTGHIHITLPNVGGNGEWLVKTAEGGVTLMTVETLAAFPKSTKTILILLGILGVLALLKGAE